MEGCLISVSHTHLFDLAVVPHGPSRRQWPLVFAACSASGGR